MTRVLKNRRDLILVALAGISFAAAVFFRFALIGYSFSALIFAGIGALLLVYALLGQLSRNNKKAARTAVRVLSMVVVLGLAIFISALVPVSMAAKSDRDPEAEYVIVLGAGLNGVYPSLSLLNRLTAALWYLEEYPDAVAIVSGGQGEGEHITEAEAMRVWLEGRGVDPGRIIKEERATSTVENIAFSLDIIKERGGDTTGAVAIVSSEYHLYRAKVIGESMGARPLVVAGGTGNAALRANYFMREACGVIYMWVFGVESTILTSLSMGAK